MVRQCRFKYNEDDFYNFGGIYCKFDNGDEYIICGCCGGIVDVNEVKILEIYEVWVDISHEIMGE